MRRRHSVPAVLALTLVGLAGCSDDTSSGADDPGGTVSATGSASDSPSPTASPSDGPSASAGEPTGESTDMASGSPGVDRTYTPRSTPDRLPRSRTEAANLHYAYLGRNAASTPQEKAVVVAWMTYWQGAADTYYLYRPTALFESVARGSARSDVIGYLAELKAGKKRVVGWAEDNVTSVKVDGDSATVRDCTRNYTFTVDRESEPLSRVVPFYDATGTLKRTGGTWTVVDQSSKDLTKSCLG